uniref:Uncharacterized protein n=1 Tax=Meloidogyne hapla TaxID=6305 RepID=A0A1I8C0E3_MELHA
MPRVLFNTTHYNHQIISKVVPTTVTPTNTSFLSSSTLTPNNNLFPVVNNIGGIALFALVLAAFFCFCICVICLGGLCADLSSAATKHRCFCCCCFCCECCLEEQIEEEENNNESDFSYRRWQRRRLRRQNQSNLIYNAATAVHMPSMLLLQLMLADSINNYNKNNKNIGGLQMMNNSKKGFEGEGRLSI